ncbi:MAG: type II toxin-antitoxin system PemK/MazF family toxin [Campylobacterales bacterium]|nr:type II toxin-antitoxin system PemK/MazF family toxin [Campylobacterales bacterium]
MISQGEIWNIQLDPTIGQEIGKSRPCIVVSHNSAGALRLRIIVPITAWKPYYTEVPWMVKIAPEEANGLHKESSADAFQVKSVSLDRFVQKLGSVTPQQLSAIHTAIAKTLNSKYNLY